ARTSAAASRSRPKPARRLARRRFPLCRQGLRGAHREIAGKARQVGLFGLPQGGYCGRPAVYCFFCATFLLLVLCTAFFVVLCALLEATFFLLVVFFATVAVLPRSLSACACDNSPASTSAATQTCESFLILRDMQARSPSVPSPYSPQYLW